jgi:hypothetical protein
MKYLLTVAIIAASAAFAGGAAADSFPPAPQVRPYFSNFLSPPGPELCDWPQACWSRLQKTLVVTPAPPVLIRGHR